MSKTNTEKTMLERFIPEFSFRNPIFATIVNFFSIILENFKTYVNNNINEDI